MNVHQACLISSEAIVKRRATAMGFPVSARNTARSISIDNPIPYYNDTEDIHALARNVLEGVYAPTFVPGQRRVLETEVVEHSFQMLDHILKIEEGRYIPIVEAAYQSACRSIELRLGESIAIGWTVCEQLVSEEWKNLLTVHNMSGKRRDKLLARDYTASVMVEMLELYGKLPVSLYKNLEIARKQGTNAHDMDAPSSSDVSACQQAIKELLVRKGIHLSLQLGFRGAGGGTWPLSSFQEVHGNQIPGFIS